MRDQAEDLIAAQQEWERQELQRKMNKTIAKVFAKARPARVAKHPKGATKQTVAARKAKNRSKRKARR